MSTARFIKTDVLAAGIYPQLPYFCGASSVLAVLRCATGEHLDEHDLHRRYGIDPSIRKERGMSNWDIIRLFNAGLLDAGRTPHTLLLCGNDYVRKHWIADQRFREWMKATGNYGIVHLRGHYAAVAGVYEDSQGDWHFVLVDSGRRRGPVRSINHSQLHDLASADARYGVILLSLTNITGDWIGPVSEAMAPPETVEQIRLPRLAQQ
ncbi:MAG TPA: hypothetical protein VK034_24875 [Enhygromyxa sp.]|nr:hypothetical protein [Enhygromyxa sp.]